MVMTKEQKMEKRLAARAALKLVVSYIMSNKSTPKEVLEAAQKLTPKAQRVSWVKQLFPTVGTSLTITEIFMASKMALGLDGMKKLAKKYAEMGTIIEESKKGEDIVFTLTAIDDDKRKAYVEARKAKKAARKDKVSTTSVVDTAE
jgi:hypothetical protein